VSPHLSRLLELEQELVGDPSNFLKVLETVAVGLESRRVDVLRMTFKVFCLLIHNLRDNSITFDYLTLWLT
jgi:hypothetical protein